MNDNQEQFGSDRLQQALSSAAPDGKSLKQTMDSLLNTIRGHAAGASQSDDLTVLMIQYKGVAQK